MIKYQLRCGAEHHFEGWFRSSADYDAEAGAGRLECPACGSSEVGKAIMAPAVATGESRAERLAHIRASMAEAAARARDYVQKNYDYVGERFPEEARRIHYGETEERRIYGEASGSEVKALVEEGVGVAPMPAAAVPERAGAAKIAPKAVPAAAKKPLN